MIFFIYEIALLVSLILILVFHWVVRFRLKNESLDEQKAIRLRNGYFPIVMVLIGTLFLVEVIEKKDLSVFGMVVPPVFLLLGLVIIRKRVGLLFNAKTGASKEEGVSIVPRSQPDVVDGKVVIPDTVDEVDWDNWVYTEQAVLCFILKEGKVLLIHKKTGLGTGKINAPGGRIEANETPLAAAVRETEEEVCLTPFGLEKVADLRFIFLNGYSLRAYVFFANDCKGEMRETREADPFWVDISNIPYDKMWEDDKEWLPLALAGKKVDARFIFDEDMMISKQVVEV